MFDLFKFSFGRFENICMEGGRCYTTDNKIVKSSYKYEFVYLKGWDFMDYNVFYNTLSICKPGVRYSVLTRVCYLGNFEGKHSSSIEWKSLGKQIGLEYIEESEYIDKIKYIQKIIKFRLDVSMELYDYEGCEVAGLQFLIYELNYTNIIVKKSKFNLNSLGEYKSLIKPSIVKRDLNSILPFTYNKNQFGVLLRKISLNGYVSNIILINGDKININELINKVNPSMEVRFKLDTDFYLSNLNGEDIIIIVKSISNMENSILVCNTEGMILHQIYDKLVGDDYNHFKRSIGNVVLYISGGEIYNKEIVYKLNSILPTKNISSEKNKSFPDYKIGSMDLETYIDSDNNISKIYAAGFHVEKHTETFYIESDLNSDNVLLKCLDAMLKAKYNGYTFYIHNLGNYDGVFMLYIILSNNTTNNDKYKYRIILRDDKILSLYISKRINKNTYNIKIVDSYNILASKQEKLAIKFNTEVKKGYFPYKFVNKNTLFYSGNKPSISFYENIKQDIYDNISNEWSTELETTKYLEKDLISLYQIMKSFQKSVWLNYHIQMTNSITISSLAMDIFLQRYYKARIPLINNRTIYRDIKKTYYGGITEVYKPYGENLYYYDVNSLYPYSALNSMPGLNCVFINDINKNISECLDLFGFFYCKIKTSDLYIGLLPVRSEEGIIMPNGYIEGWYFSEELKFCYENGYNIQILYGYKFDKENNVFDKYINDIYHMKRSATNEVDRNTAKSLINNLLGRFGLNIDKTITKLVSYEEYMEILQCKEVKNVRHISDKFLVTHVNEISKEICDSHNVDFYKVITNKIRSTQGIGFTQDQFYNVSVAISSAVTSYARIFMNKVKLDIIKRGGYIYYSDTDSLVTNIPLDPNLVGSDIGQFKLEYNILEGYFISSKTYCIKTDKLDKDNNNIVVIKTKGANSDSLSFEDFKELYVGNSVNSSKSITTKNYSLGSVSIIKNKEITLSSSSYKKRTKVYDLNNNWIETKPLIQ